MFAFKDLGCFQFPAPINKRWAFLGGPSLLRERTAVSFKGTTFSIEMSGITGVLETFLLELSFRAYF